jgi:hypothetical protein
MYGLLFEGLKEYIFNLHDGAYIWGEVLKRVDAENSAIDTKITHSQPHDPSISLIRERVDEQHNTAAVDAGVLFEEQGYLPSSVGVCKYNTSQNNSDNIDNSSDKEGGDTRDDSSSRVRTHQQHDISCSWKSNRDYPDIDFFRLLRICANVVGFSEEKLKEELGCAFFIFLRRYESIAHCFYALYYS